MQLYSETQLLQMLTDFQNSFTDGLCNKFTVNPRYIFPRTLSVSLNYFVKYKR